MRRHGGGIAAPHQPRPAEVEVRGDDGNALRRINAQLLEYRPRVAQVLLRAGGALLRVQPALVHAAAHQRAAHTLGLGDGLARPLSAGEDHRHVWVLLQIRRRGVDARAQCERRRFAVHARAEHDDRAHRRVGLVCERTADDHRFQHGKQGKAQ